MDFLTDTFTDAGRMEVWRCGGFGRYFHTSTPPYFHTSFNASDASITAAGLVGLDGLRSVGQPLYLDDLHAFAAAVTLVRRGMFERAGARGPAS